MEALDLGDNRGPALSSYAEISSAPLTGFIFALPLFVVYHVGLWWLNTFAGLRWANAIDIAIADGLAALGMAGPLLSFILVVIVFLAMHALSGRPWRWPPARVWLFMIMESVVWALPVFMLVNLVTKVLDYLPLSAVEGAQSEVSWRANMVLSCGAGVYEEFFFRILVMGVLVVFLDKVAGIEGAWKYGIAAVLQAVLFAASHHLPGGPEAIRSLEQIRQAAPVISFRVVAGIYFAVLYLERGFGVAAGAHAGYDVMVVLLDVFMPMDGA